MTPDALSPDRAPPPPHGSLRGHAGVVAVLAIGLSALAALEGPREWATFSRMLLPVLALSLGGTFAGCAAVRRRAIGRLSGYPLLGSIGGFAGGVLGVGLSALVRGRSLELIASRPLAWHLISGSLVTGALVGVALWWLARLRSQDRRRDRQLLQSRVDVLSARADAAEAETARARAALQLLQAQVEPHFLYNALANLRYLVRHDGELAQRLIDNLVRYFRVALPSLREVEVTLAQELELCSAFGAIQALRAGDRVQLDIDVAPALRSALLPPALLLTLVENAFKHGAPGDAAVARVTVAARGIGAELRLSVTDNGDGTCPLAC